MMLDRALAGDAIVLAGHSGPVRALRFLPDAQRLASASQDGTLRIWDVPTGRSPRVLRGHESFVYAVAASADGRLLATASWDGTVRLWDARTSAPVRTLRVPGGATALVTSAAFSPDSQRLFAGTRTGRLVAFRIDGAVLAERAFDLGVHELTVAPDGAIVAGLSPYEAVSNQGRSVLLDDVTLADRSGPAPGGTTIAYGPGSRVAWSTLAAALVIARCDTGEELARDATAAQPAISLSWSKDGSRIAGVALDGTLRVWNDAGRLLLSRPVGDTRTWAVAYSPDGRRLATGGQEGTIRIWDAATFEPLADLRGHEAYVYCLAWTPDGRTLLSGSGDATARVWTTRTAVDFAAGG